jgi:RNA polymerase sigma-70 factor (ECF subfamily)
MAYAPACPSSPDRGEATPMESQGTEDSVSTLMRVARGEADAVDELLARYRPLVWSIVRRGVTHDLAEDVVQEIFIHLWRNAHRFDPAIATEATFVGMIARRRLVDRMRSERVRSAPETLPDGLSSDVDDFEAIDLWDEAQRAERAMAEIRPEEQRVLRMSISGLSHSEIARRTETPLGTVKSQARRGLERVRQLIEKEGGREV